MRATNTGISAVVTPAGDLVAIAGVHERATLLATLRPEDQASTLVLAWGDWFGPSALAAGLVLLLAGRATPSASSPSPS